MAMVSCKFKVGVGLGLGLGCGGDFVLLTIAQRQSCLPDPTTNGNDHWARGSVSKPAEQIANRHNMRYLAGLLLVSQRRVHVISVKILYCDAPILLQVGTQFLP